MGIHDANQQAVLPVAQENKHWDGKFQTMGTQTSSEYIP